MRAKGPGAGVPRTKCSDHCICSRVFVWQWHNHLKKCSLLTDLLQFLARRVVSTTLHLDAAAASEADSYCLAVNPPMADTDPSLRDQIAPRFCAAGPKNAPST